MTISPGHTSGTDNLEKNLCGEGQGERSARPWAGAEAGPAGSELDREFLRLSKQWERCSPHLHASPGPDWMEGRVEPGSGSGGGGGEESAGAGRAWLGAQAGASQGQPLASCLHFGSRVFMLVFIAGTRRYDPDRVMGGLQGYSPAHNFHQCLLSPSG